MNQFDFLDFLKLNPGKWFNSPQLAKATKSTNNCVCERMRRLRKSNLVDFEFREFRGRETYYYKAK